MSRSGYTDDCESNWSLICWRGAVKSAIRGRRGQKLLQELAMALDAMPVKRLITNDLENAEGEFCTLGVLGAARGLREEFKKVDPEDSDEIAALFDIAPALAREIVYENDEGDVWREYTPAQRWSRMREWVDDNLIKSAPQSEKSE